MNILYFPHPDNPSAEERLQRQLEEKEQEIEDLKKQLEMKAIPFSGTHWLAICDHRLTGERYRVYQFLKLKQGKHTSARIRNDLAAGQLGMSVRSYQEYIQDLKANGFIDIREEPGRTNTIHVRSLETVYGHEALAESAIWIKSVEKLEQTWEEWRTQTLPKLHSSEKPDLARKRTHKK